MIIPLSSLAATVHFLKWPLIFAMELNHPKFAIGEELILNALRMKFQALLKLAHLWFEFRSI